MMIFVSDRVENIVRKGKKNAGYIQNSPVLRLRHLIHEQTVLFKKGLISYYKQAYLIVLPTQIYLVLFTRARRAPCYN